MINSLSLVLEKGAVEIIERILGIGGFGLCYLLAVTLGKSPNLSNAHFSLPYNEEV